jgi:hypothetical protein
MFCQLIGGIIVTIRLELSSVDISCCSRSEVEAIREDKPM